MPHITAHAVQRYIERVEAVEPAVALLRLQAVYPTIERACAFGCDLVRMGNGARLRLDGDVVVTVLPKRGR